MSNHGRASARERKKKKKKKEKGNILFSVKYNMNL
jgi:hypothetical protein